jgi:AraC-like DNA-binding protein
VEHFADAAEETEAVIEIFRVGPNERPPLAACDRYEYFVALRGRAAFASVGSARELGPAEAAFVLPGEPRAIRGTGSRLSAACRTSARVARISIPSSWAEGGQRARLTESLAERPAGERSALVLGADCFSSFVRKTESLLAENADVSPSLRGSIAESLFLDLSLDLLQDRGERRAEDAPYWLRRACAAMSTRKNLLAGSERLAELAGKSREHVIRQMRRYYGMTPTQFVNELRLRTASGLLIDSDRPVLDIGYSLGFQNPSYFAQLFKEKFGMSPTRFRAVRRR